MLVNHASLPWIDLAWIGIGIEDRSLSGIDPKRVGVEVKNCALARVCEISGCHDLPDIAPP